ncbi:MAG: hypothetical protein KIT16_18045 [Rhodospirillaceae bacterium]|nr:hypothetical protein [Rhodospirillaceae bacterium]
MPAAADVPVKLSKAQVRSVEAAVRGRLKDPGSARFDKVLAARRADGRVYVCGLVNARNSYGGYAGRSPFIGRFDGHRFIVISVTNEREMQAAVYQTCAARGMPMQ